MESIETVAERIVALSPGSPDRQTCVNAVKFNITCLVDDVLKLVKNINETSLSPTDRFNRILELEQRYGVPKTHLL